MFLLKVVAPISVQIAVAAQSAQSKDRFSAGQTPPGIGDVHPGL